MNARSILAVLLISACAACSSASNDGSNSNSGKLENGGDSDGGADAGAASDAAQGADDSSSSSSDDASSPLTFSACLLAGTGVHSIVLVAEGSSVCAQVAAYTVVDPSQPAATSRSPNVTTTPSAWAYRGAFAGANTGHCGVGNTPPPVTDISGTIAVDPTDASTISVNVVVDYADDSGPQTLTISANDVAVAPSCP